jgi:hypothetical protein
VGGGADESTQLEDDLASFDRHFGETRRDLLAEREVLADDLTLNSGAWVTMTAERGIYHRDEEALDLFREAWECPF